MQTLNKGNSMQIVTGFLFLTLVTGCAEWNSAPVVVEQNFGRAATNMVQNQTLCPEHGQMAENPELCPEHGQVIGLDGQKAGTIIDAYRQSDRQFNKEPIENAKQGAKFDVKNVGSSVGSQ